MTGEEMERRMNNVEEAVEAAAKAWEGRKDD